MDAELQKLVDAGKLTSAGAAQLNQLKPGAFCLHKSWGFGRVADWNLLLNQILIDFEKKKGHPMQVQYAAENLTPIPADHFLARKANDLPALTQVACLRFIFFDSARDQILVMLIPIYTVNRCCHSDFVYRFSAPIDEFPLPTGNIEQVPYVVELADFWAA